MVPVQFIIQAAAAEACIKQAEAVLTAGGKWIELCVASLSSKEAMEVSAHLLKRCHAREATFCVVDDVDLCREVGADGVCLTREDCRVDEVREALGHEFIIGATASSFERLKLLKRMSADYVSVCTTEGLEHLREVILKAHDEQLRLPISVQLVGALGYGDAKKVIESGADGVAMNCSAVLPVNLEEVVNTLLHLDD